MEIRTKDADEAAFFWVHEKIELSSTELKYGYKKKVLWFVFNSTLSEGEFNDLRNNYLNGKTLVEPKAYAAKRAEVKNLIRENIFSQ